jgi:hypothetical protein
VQFDRKDEPLADFILPGGFLLMGQGDHGCEWEVGNAFIDDVLRNFGKSHTYCHAAFVLGEAKDYKQYEDKEEQDQKKRRSNDAQKDDMEVAVLHAGSGKGTYVSLYSRSYFNAASKHGKLVSMQVKEKTFSKAEIKKVLDKFIGRPYCLPHTYLRAPEGSCVYCSSLIYEIYKSLGIKVDVNFSKEIAMGKEIVITPDDLFNSKSFSVIRKNR